MKLLYVENTLAIHGGIERVLTDKLNWLVEYGGFEVCLLIANQGNHPIVFPLHPKVECHDLGIMFHQIYQYSRWKRYRQLSLLHRLFRQRLIEQIRIYSPDVIICTRFEYICDVMKIRGSVPVVYESHSSFLACKYEEYSWLQKLQIKYIHRALKKAQMIVALTEGDALEWKRINPNVQVIPNVVHLNDTGRYSDCLSNSAIFVGRYSYQKDLNTLLQIWGRVCTRHPDWQLHIFGGYGGLQEEFQLEIKRTGMNIVIHQPTALIYKEYLKSSILLMTSRYEPFGLVLPEAMSCGIPVIAFDCPYGPADIIADGKDGFLIPNRSLDDYVAKLCLLIENDHLRKKMGQAGILSSRRYDTNHIMPMWKDLFEKLVEKAKLN